VEADRGGAGRAKQARARGRPKGAGRVGPGRAEARGAWGVFAPFYFFVCIAIYLDSDLNSFDLKQF
jgi:hypothetical protein